jgi:hypothetical protein
VPEFDAPHQQPEVPPPSEEKLVRKVPVAIVLTVVISAAALGLLLWLILAAMSR